MRNLIVIAIIIILFSCNNDKVKNSINLKQTTNNVEIQLIDTISLLSNELFRSDMPLNIENINNKEYITGYMTRENKLLIFDIQKQKCIKIINFKKEGPDGIGRGLFTKVISWDSIFVISRGTTTLNLLDSSANIINKYNFNKMPSGGSVFNIHAEKGEEIQFFNGKLLFLKIPNYFPSDPKFYNDTLLIVYNIKDSTIQNKIGKYPEIYKKDVNYGLLDIYPYFATNCDGNYIISYPLEDRILVCNDSVVLNEYRIKSNFLDEVPPKPDVIFGDGTWEQNIKYHINKGSYAAIIYDKYRKFYYRVVMHPSDLYDNNTKIKPEDVTFSLQIINSDFKLLDEITFPSKTFDPKNILVVNEGLLISINNEHNESFKEDEIKLLLFKIQ